MTTEEFNGIVEGRCELIREVLASKAAEYARGDRLSNFRKAAGILGGSAEAACVGFWMKHIVSIVDLVQDIEKGKVAPQAMWAEKIGDAINYLILLEALVDERSGMLTRKKK